MQTPIQIIHNPESALLDQLGVSNWSIWEKGISTFPWIYDEDETCYFLEGEVTVTPLGGEPVLIRAGDLVRFRQGVECTWDVHAPIRKHFHFGPLEGDPFSTAQAQ